MLEVKAPGNWEHYDPACTVFLSGSIDMGDAPDWQAIISDGLSDIDKLILLNPRRDDWDSSWVQSFEDARFVEQVEWELNALDKADYCVHYFAPGGTAPISLLELGLRLYLYPKRSIVCAPEGFWRKGNVEITSRYYGATYVQDIQSVVEILKSKLV